MTNKQWIVAMAMLAGCADNGEISGYFGEEPNSFEGLDKPPSEEAPGPAVCGGVEVHVIGIYETGSDHARTGDGLVRIERPGLHALVLSSYEPTRWKIELAEGARIQSIHLVGYHAQTVMPPHEDITITTDTYDQTKSGACGYSWPYNGEGCDTNELLAIAKDRTNTTDVTSFAGCYQASRFTIDRNMIATSDCATSAGYKQYGFHGNCKAPE
jgi:hypothetical protein